MRLSPRTGYQARSAAQVCALSEAMRLLLAPFLLEAAAAGTLWRKPHYLFSPAMKVVIAIFSLAAVLHNKLVPNV